jgi:hypothetical protein
MIGITGCVSTKEQAVRTTEQQEAERQIEEKKLQEEAMKVFVEGWPKLQKGMTAEQVEELLGHWHGLTFFLIPPSVGFPTTIILDGYTLEFDAGRLESWSFLAGRNAGKFMAIPHENGKGEGVPQDNKEAVKEI